MYATYYFCSPSFISRTSRQNVGWTVISFIQCIFALNWSKEIKPHAIFFHRRNANMPKLSRVLPKQIKAVI